MTRNPLPPDQYEARCRQVADLARDILAGGATLVRSAPEMIRRLTHLAVPCEDPDFEAFILISSETDHLPIGSERQYWEPAALALKDHDLADAEAWAAEFGFDTCRRLVERFGRRVGAEP